jgi:hypothetical protein
MANVSMMLVALSRAWRETYDLHHARARQRFSRLAWRPGGGAVIDLVLYRSFAA